MKKNDQRKLNYWKQHKNEWQKAGVSKSQYCRENKLKIFNFQYWIKKLNILTQSTALVKIKPISVNTQGQPLEIMVNDKIKIRVPPEFDPKHLKCLLEALEIN